MKAGYRYKKKRSLRTITTKFVHHKQKTRTKVNHKSKRRLRKSKRRTQKKRTQRKK